MNLREKINQECKKKGWMQKDLAKFLQKEPSNLHNQISNEDTVQLGLLKSICKELNIPVEYLVSATCNREESMIHEQLDRILEDGDAEIVESILGKIAREYIRTVRSVK